MLMGIVGKIITKICSTGVHKTGCRCQGKSWVKASSSLQFLSFFFKSLVADKILYYFFLNKQQLV